MDVKILGAGCSKCKVLFANTEKAGNQLGLDLKIEKIEDYEEMMKYNILTTPVLMINGEMVIKGKVADVEEIKNILKLYV